MKRNKLGQIVIFVFLTILILFTFEFLPSIKAGKFTFRPVQLLSQIKKDTTSCNTTKVTLPTPAIRTKFNTKIGNTTTSKRNKDSIFLCYSIPEKTEDGILPIEDYSNKKSISLNKFYKKLYNSKHKKVRIAYYGDSFIQGDILTANLRSMLQTTFGGHGVGFVSITSNIWGFRRSVSHRFKGWESHYSTDTANFDAKLQGIDNRYFIPKERAYVRLKGVKNGYANLDTCGSATLYGIIRDSSEITFQINNGEIIKKTLKTSKNLQKIEINKRIGSLIFNTPAQKRSIYYGISLEDKTGINLDNFSLQGASGYQLCGIPLKSLKEWNTIRPYDLIIFQYGLNAATKNQTNFSNYSLCLKKMIKHYRQAFPNTPLLLIGIGDRAYHSNGEYKTMIGVKHLMRAQQRVCKEENIAFWNLYEAMGGEGSIVDMTNAHPSLANKDYTHINFRGGKHLAKILYKAIIFGEKDYLKKEILK